MTARGWVEGQVPQRGFWGVGLGESPPRVPRWRNVAGFVRGPWGITREEWGSWNLTHTPTGTCVGGFRQRRWAESFAAALDRLPIDWTALRIKTVADAVAPFKQELKALMAQRRSFRPPQPTGRAAAYSRKAGAAGLPR